MRIPGKLCIYIYIQMHVCVIEERGEKNGIFLIIQNTSLLIIIIPIHLAVKFTLLIFLQILMSRLFDQWEFRSLSLSLSFSPSLPLPWFAGGTLYHLLPSVLFAWCSLPHLAASTHIPLGRSGFLLVPFLFWMWNATFWFRFHICSIMFNPPWDPRFVASSFTYFTFVVGFIMIHVLPSLFLSMWYKSACLLTLW